VTRSLAATLAAAQVVVSGRAEHLIFEQMHQFITVVSHIPHDVIRMAVVVPRKDVTRVQMGPIASPPRLPPDPGGRYQLRQSMAMAVQPAAGSACVVGGWGGRVERRYAWRRALDRRGRSARKFCPKVSSGADPNPRASVKPRPPVHGDDEREATAEDEGHYEKPCCPPGFTGFCLRTPWRRRGDVEQLHDAQHDNVATSRVNDWAVSLMASAMARYGVHVVASCSIV
jgi:hypothetical protein